LFNLHSEILFLFFLDGRNHIVLARWISEGIRRKGELFVVNMIDVRVEVDGIISHGIDLANALELKVVRSRSVEIDSNNGAGIHCLVILFLSLPPGVGDLHGKADESRRPFLINEDEALGLGGRRRHRDGR